MEKVQEPNNIVSQTVFFPREREEVGERERERESVYSNVEQEGGINVVPHILIFIIFPELNTWKHRFTNLPLHELGCIFRARLAELYEGVKNRNFRTNK
jgi:hypothetical protein